MPLFTEIEMSSSSSVTIAAPSAVPISSSYGIAAADDYAAQTQYAPFAATIQTPEWYSKTVQPTYQSPPAFQTAAAVQPAQQYNSYAFDAADAQPQTLTQSFASPIPQLSFQSSSSASSTYHPSVPSSSVSSLSYSSLRAPHSRTVFYNTQEGAKIIASARAALSNRSKPLDLSTHKSDIQENRQRAFHQDCLYSKTARDYTQPKLPHFRHYPMEEYHRFDADRRLVVGPNPHVGTRPIPVGIPGGTDGVLTRHNMVKNLKKNQSTSNYNHGRNFISLHTNHLQTF